MHRWHGRELVGDAATYGPVDRLVVELRGIHKSERREHARRRHRNQLDDQADPREERDRVPHGPVAIAVTDEEPDQEDDERWHVHDGVVAVEELHDQRMGQNRLLERELAREVQISLRVPDP